MEDYERFIHSDNGRQQPPHDFGSNVRMLFQGLTLAGVLWVASSLSSQNENIARLQEQIADLKVTLSGVPALKDRVTVLEQRQVFISSRQDNDESLIDGNSQRTFKHKAIK